MSFQLCFGDEQRRLAKLKRLGAPLEKLGRLVDFEMFRPLLDEVFANPDRTHACGRRRWDSVVMFKIMIIQQLHNMADEDTELMINDRLSFQDFCGFNLSSTVPDAKTIWAYRNKLAMSGKASLLFDMFDSLLAQKGLITKRGSFVDASFVDVPRQRNTKTQNATIRRDEIPEE